MLGKDHQNEYKGTPLEARIVETLDSLHRQYAQKKEFKKAIDFLKLEGSIEPNTDASYLGFYEYME